MLKSEETRFFEETLHKELDKIKEDVISKHGMTEMSLNALNKIIDTFYKFYKMDKKDDYSGRGYSCDGRYWEAQGSYADGMGRNYEHMQSNTSYDDGGYSGRHYVRGHYSRDDSKSLMIERLENLMHSANTEKDRDTIRDTIATLKNM